MQPRILKQLDFRVMEGHKCRIKILFVAHTLAYNATRKDQQSKAGFANT